MKFSVIYIHHVLMLGNVPAFIKHIVKQVSTPEKKYKGMKNFSLTLKYYQTHVNSPLFTSSIHRSGSITMRVWTGILSDNIQGRE